MVGSRSSFKTKLQEKSPRLIIFQCVSHSSAIVATYACAKISDVEDIVKDLPSFLNASSKRTAIFRSIVFELGYAFQKIPRHSETRWACLLSLYYYYIKKLGSYSSVSYGPCI